MTIHDSNSRLRFKIRLFDESWVANLILFWIDSVFETNLLKNLIQNAEIRLKMSNFEVFESNFCILNQIFEQIRFKNESNQCNWINRKSPIWIVSHDYQKVLNRHSSIPRRDRAPAREDEIREVAWISNYISEPNADEGRGSKIPKILLTSYEYCPLGYP